MKCLILLCYLALPVLSPAQVPERLEKCLPYRTFAQEIRQANAEKDNEEPPPKPIHIKSLTFNSDNPLPANSKQIASEVKANAKIQDGPDWPLELGELVRDAWQQRGYFKVQVDFSDVDILRDAAREQVVRLAVKVDPGKLYRLNDIKFSQSTIASPAELRSVFPIDNGDIFDTHKFGKGIDGLRYLYNEHGFINFAAVPSFQINESSSLITLILELDEGKQFRVGKFTILGLEASLAQTLIAESGLERGSIFNPRLLKQFFERNRSVVPSDANPDNDVERKANEQKATVDIIMDFRSCP